MSSPARNLAHRRRTPLPGFRSAERWTAENAGNDMAVYQVFEYLTQYPQVLEEYLLEYASLDFLETVLAKKNRSDVQKSAFTSNACKSVEPKTTLGVPYSEIGINGLSQKIIEFSSDMDMYVKIHEMSRLLSSVIIAENYTLYVMEEKGNDLSIFDPTAKHKLKHVGPVGYKLTVSAHVAVDRNSVNATDIQQDARFPKGVCVGDTHVHHVICVPILLTGGSVFAVVELTRGWESDKFSTRDFDLVVAILSWVTACVQKYKMNKILTMQTKMNHYLLDSTKVLFDDIDNVDQLVTNIMTFTKDLVSAERCSLFLVDQKRKELFADYFDEGMRDGAGTPLYTKKSQIRFANDRGIAGYVATSGEIVNIHNAYEDERFNPDIDKKTGYQTRNILCMPIMGKQGVLGVVQMLNRKGADHFSQEDEAAFKMFAVYCAIALHYSRIYNLLAHQQAKYKVVMEVLQYHINADEETTQNLISNPMIDDSQVPATFYEYDFCCYDYDAILPQLFIHMITKCFPSTFEIRTMCHFVLTVRKNYRHVTYHNWQHGFHVAHSLWRMIATCKTKVLTRLEKMGMMVAGICHDIDHRGFNNDFLKKQKHPLAALYSTSTMEQHHYKQTVTILHAEGNDIFSFLTADQHREMLEIIRKSILATDLSLYFANQKFLSGLIEESKFDPKEPDHMVALRSLMMTAADLCAVCKPWETQQYTTDFLYEEFYMQGDAEKKSGLTPLPMMDRENKEDIPKQQIGFSNFICIPVYTTLSKLLPNTKPLLDGCVLNEEKWKLLIIEKENKKSTINCNNSATK